MNRLGIAGALWLGTAGFAIVITLSFVTDTLRWVVTLAIGVVAPAVGPWLSAHPRAQGVSASNAISVV
jgi:hypothetical protein